MTVALTYSEVGATRDGPLPAGYGHVGRDVRLGHGRETFELAAESVLDWRMHRAAGFAVHSPAGRAAPGADVALRAGWGPLGLTIPCRVVYTVDDEDLRGFGYGTLPGHPERGEEAFLISIDDGGEVRFRIRAFSRPATLPARLGGPLTRLIQRYATDRYVNALRRLVLRG